MSGHSKWNNIKHKKEKTDAQKAKVFTKVGKEIAIAVREGGADPASNSKLRDLISKAKSLNVPNDNIDRIIKKASGADGVVYENVTYEGYGPSGVAVIVEAATDNRNCTGGEIRLFGESAEEMLKKDPLRFRRTCQMVFQNPFDTFDPRYTLKRILEEPMKLHRIGNSEEERMRIILDILEQSKSGR